MTQKISAEIAPEIKSSLLGGITGFAFFQERRIDPTKTKAQLLYSMLQKNQANDLKTIASETDIPLEEVGTLVARLTIDNSLLGMTMEGRVKGAFYIPSGVQQEPVSQSVLVHLDASSHCSNCGGELPAGAKFCRTCGHRISGSSPSLENQERNSFKVEAKRKEQSARKELSVRRQETLEKILKKVKRMLVQDLVELLEFPDTRTLTKWLLDLPDDYPLKLDGSAVIIETAGLKTQQDVQQTIDDLLSQFEEWEESQHGKME